MKMKIVSEEKTFVLMPENGRDCFDLGYLSGKLDNTMTVSGNPNFSVTEMKISTSELLKFILKRENK